MGNIVYRYATDSPNRQLLIKKLTLVFDSLKGAANFNEAFGYVLKNVEDGSCRYYYPHEKNTLMERSKVVLAKKILKKTLTRNRSVNTFIFKESTRKLYRDNFCLFRALALHSEGNDKLEEKTSKPFVACLQKMEGVDAAKFESVFMNDIPFIQDLTKTNIFLYEIDIMKRPLVGELARRNIKIFPTSWGYYVTKNTFVMTLKATLTSKTIVAHRVTNSSIDQENWNLERHKATCKEWVRSVFPTNEYQLRETLFDKLTDFDIPYTDERKPLNNIVTFHLGPFCLEDEEFKVTGTTTWIGKRIQVSVSISSKLEKDPIVLREIDPRNLVSSFIYSLK